MKYTHLFFIYFYFFEDQESSYIEINRVLVSEYQIDMKLRSGILAGSSLQEKKFIHLYFFFYLISDKSNLCINNDKQFSYWKMLLTFVWTGSSIWKNKYILFYLFWRPRVNLHWRWVSVSNILNRYEISWHLAGSSLRGMK